MVKTLGLATLGVAVFSFLGGFAGATYWITHEPSPTPITQFAHTPQQAAILAVDTGNTGLDLITWQGTPNQPDELRPESSFEDWPTIEPFAAIDNSDEAGAVPYIGSFRTDLEQS